MDLYEELRRQADRRRPAGPIPDWTGGRHGDRAPGSPRRPGRDGQTLDRAGGSRAAAANGPESATTQAAMLIQLQHKPEEFDPGHCRACASQAGMLDHYWRVQQEGATLRETQRWARGAHRRASVALWSSGAAIVLAAVALLTG
jgi:hypothetical protein